MSHFRNQPSLPKFAIPETYDLRLIPDPVAGTFAGTVAIEVVIVEETRWIVVNAADLSVDSDSVSFTPRDSPEVLLLRIKQYEECEIVVLEFREFLPKGVSLVKMSFNGIASEETLGFFRRHGKKHARRCFPCWDEPDFKATFKITLEVPTDFVALSNMPVMEEKIEGNVKIVSYHKSPLMSTYLVSLVVGLLEYLEGHTCSGIRVRVYSEMGKAEQGKVALDVGLKTLDLFKEYFAVPYPLPKLDMIAVPDFAAESRESYGLTAATLSNTTSQAPGDDPVFGAAPDASQMNQFLQILGLFFNPEYTKEIKRLNPELQSMTLKPEFLRLLYSTEAMQQMVILQQSLFSGYWHTNSQARDQTGATKGTGNNAEEMEIFADDVVMNKKTRGIGVVSKDKLSVFPIAKAEVEELRKDEVVVVSRKFCHGQNICSVTDRRKLGVICGIETKVDLATSTGDITHQDIGTELLERIRSFFVGDVVVYGSWSGVVEDLELSINVQLEDGEKITNADPDPDVLVPIFTNAAEAHLDRPYYRGQAVVLDTNMDRARGHVVRHGVNTVTENWIHTSVPGETRPPQVLRYNQLKRLHNIRISKSAWELGQRCVLEGEDFVIANLRTRVTVKWQDGTRQEVNGTDLVKSRKELFSGQFVSKKNQQSIGGFVRMLVDGVAWVKWFLNQQPELPYSFELQILCSTLITNSF